MKKTESEVAIIDFTKFDIAQLPELKGKKVEIAKLIKANPIVEITDNASYELAKKSRTAVKSLRTGLQSEQKDVKKRIKECVLDVVDAEYDSIIESVRIDENARQEPITTWETAKENERLEKLRLEQERVDNIKKSIGEFRSFWEDKLSEMNFATIEDIRDDYSVAVVEFDRDSLAEFDVLFTDAVNYLDNILEQREKTLTEQEQIRLDQEKLRIQNSISNWFNSWSDAILKYPTSAICQDNFAIFNKEKGLECGEFQSEFGAKRTQLVEYFEARIQGLKTLEFAQEEQKKAQENFAKEKKEFEEKQAEAKYQERKKFLVDEDYWNIYFTAECESNEDVAKSRLLNYVDFEFENFKKSVIVAKTPIEVVEEVKSDELASWSEEGRLVNRDGILWDTHLNEPFDATKQVKILKEIDDISNDKFPDIKYPDPRNVLPLGTTDKIDEIANNDAFITTEEIAKPKEELTWDSIFDAFIKNTECDEYSAGPHFLEYLEENYNCPTPKN